MRTVVYNVGAPAKFPMLPNHHDYMFKPIEQEAYESFKEGDFVFSLMIRSSHYAKTFLKKGVTLLPKFDMVKLWRSKIEHAKLFKDTHMPQHTTWAYNINELKNLQHYYKSNCPTSQLVTKKYTNTSGGKDVHKWKNIDHIIDYFTTAGAGQFYPMVIQPFIENYKDYRVIVMGEFVQAIHRYNPNNWKQNTDLGASITDVPLTLEEWEFVRDVQRITKFPFIFIDLMITDDNIYLGEFSLDGVEHMFSNDTLATIEIEMIKRHYKDEFDFGMTL